MPAPTPIDDRGATLDLPDGRVLSFLEVGDPAGPLVLHHHGGPSSRLEAILFETAAREVGVRLVCIDRPGMGRSSPQQERSFEGWSRDLLAMADHLGARTFGVTGWSEGGPWAIAAAAQLPRERMRHATNIAGGSYGTFGDNWAAPLQSKVDALGGRLALHFSPGFTLMYSLLEYEVRRAPKSFVKQMLAALSDADRAVLADQVILEHFIDAAAECFAQGVDGLVRDAKVLYRAWSFDVRAIDRPVHFWQGMDDRLVPAEINHRVAQAMPKAVWHPVSPGGHFIAVTRAREILSIARREIEG